MTTREEAMQSFAAYIEYVSGVEPTDEMKVVCNKLDDVVSGKTKKLMIDMRRGAGKSWCVSIHFPAYYLAKHPGKHVIAASHNPELSDFFGRKVRRTISSDEHRAVFPDSGISDEIARATRWETTNGGNYCGTSVGANLTGQRADILIGDDLFSGIRRDIDKLSLWFNDNFLTLRRDKDTPIVIVGSGLALLEFSGFFNPDDGWECVFLPENAYAE